MNTASVCARVEILFFTEVILLTLSQAVHHVISTKDCWVERFTIVYKTHQTNTEFKIQGIISTVLIDNDMLKSTVLY